MKKLTLKILLCCIPLFFMGANQPHGMMTHKEAVQFIGERQMDALETKALSLESAIKMEYSEIWYLMTLRKKSSE